MTDTPRPDNTPTWRDLSDQLAPEQCADLAALEDAGAAPDTLLLKARELAGENVAEAVMFGELDPPPDADRVFGWQADAGQGWFREFSCPTTRIGGVAMHVAGRQFNDDRRELWIDVWADDRSKLTPAQARQLGAALIAAADELNRLG